MTQKYDPEELVGAYIIPDKIYERLVDSRFIGEICYVTKHPYNTLKQYKLNSSVGFTYLDREECIWGVRFTREENPEYFL